MTRNEAVLSVLEKDYYDIEEDEGCSECGYEECRCAVEPDWETEAEDRADRMEDRYER